MKILGLINRDIRNCLNLRLTIIWLFLSGMCIFFFYATGGYTRLVEGKIEFMSILLPQIVFGAWAVLSVYYDVISSDREYNVLDCIICSNVSKKKVFISKIFAIIVISIICVAIYLLPVAILVLILTGNINYIMSIFIYFIPLWAYIMVYASLGILISILARSSKSALIWSLVAGLILMPRLFVMFAEYLGSMFNWSDATIQVISMISPGVMISNMCEFGDEKHVIVGTSVFLLSTVLLLVISLLIFEKQDEIDY